jgi:uncharacterized membrane protein
VGKMTKDKFLRELEKKLSILSEEERKDTINEYRDIIEEKVKHGKKESEAVKEFGSIDELSKEILNAYKINPDYKSKDFVDGAEELIRKGAKKISEVTDDVVDSIKQSDFECTTSNVFEIILKVIILLIFLAILKIPIYFASELGSSVFRIGVEPFATIFSWIWKGLIEIVYLGICVLLIVKLITDYSKKDKTAKTNSKVKNTKIEEKTNSKVKNTKIEEKTTKENKKVKKNDTFETIVLILVRLFVIFTIIIPLVFVAFLFIVGLVILIYLLCKGIAVYGFLIATLGCLGFIICIIDLIYRGLIADKKIYLYPFLINILLIIIGGVMSISYIFDFEYHDSLPQNRYETKTETFMEDIDKKTSISNYKTEIIVDNSIEDNKIKAEVTYYPKFVSIEKHEDTDEDEDYISFVTNEKDTTFSLNNKYTKMIMKDIKKKKIYNYNEFNDVKVKIYVNEKTKDLVEN